MTITTEEAERLATEYGGFWGLTDVAAALRSLAAERDAALQCRAAIDAAHTKWRMPIEDNPTDALQRLIEVEVNAKRDALQARVAELEGLGKAIATERNQLIGVLQLAVEQSAETGENEPAWIGPACRILNAGFTKIAALEGKKDE